MEEKSRGWGVGGSPGRKNVHREGRKIRQGRRGSRRKRRRIRQGSPGGKENPAEAANPGAAGAGSGAGVPCDGAKAGAGARGGSPGRKNVHREGRKVRQGRRGSRRKRRRIRQGSPGGKENPAEAANQPGERLAGAGKSAGRGTAGEHDEGTPSRAAGKRGAGQGRGAEV